MTIIPSSGQTGMEAWSKLGRETCNVRISFNNLQVMISKKVRKSSTYAKIVDYRATNLLRQLQGILDTLLQWTYEINTPADKEFENYLNENFKENVYHKIRNQEWSTSANVIGLTDVFYNLFDPQLLWEHNEHLHNQCKKITCDEKNYIEDFLKTLNIFLDKLEYILNDMLKPFYCGFNDFKSKKTELKKVIMNMRKWYEKLKILEEL